MAKSMTDFYKNATNDSDSSKEEQILHYENKLIEALERLDKLNNERAKVILSQQIEKLQKKIDDLITHKQFILSFRRGGARSLSEVRQISHWYAFV